MIASFNDLVEDIVEDLPVRRIFIIIIFIEHIFRTRSPWPISQIGSVVRLFKYRDLKLNIEPTLLITLR